MGWWAIVSSSLELQAPKPQNLTLQSASSVGSEVDKQSNESSFALSSSSETGALIEWGADPTFCLSVKDNTFFDGQNIWLWSCQVSVSAARGLLHGSSVDAQRWFEVGKIQFQNAANRKCIAVKENQGYNGNNVELGACEGDAEYKWWAIVTSSLELEAPR